MSSKILFKLNNDSCNKSIDDSFEYNDIISNRKQKRKIEFKITVNKKHCVKKENPKKLSSISDNSTKHSVLESSSIYSKTNSYKNSSSLIKSSSSFESERVFNDINLGKFKSTIVSDFSFAQKSVSNAKTYSYNKSNSQCSIISKLNGFLKINNRAMLVNQYSKFLEDAACLFNLSEIEIIYLHLFIFSNIENNENNTLIDEKFINENEIILSAFYIKKLLNNNNQNYNLNLLKIVSSKYSDETQFLEKLEIWLSLNSSKCNKLINVIDINNFFVHISSLKFTTDCNKHVDYNKMVDFAISKIKDRPNVEFKHNKIDIKKEEENVVIRKFEELEKELCLNDITMLEYFMNKDEQVRNPCGFEKKNKNNLDNISVQSIDSRAYIKEFEYLETNLYKNEEERNNNIIYNEYSNNHQPTIKYNFLDNYNLSEDCQLVNIIDDDPIDFVNNYIWYNKTNI